MKSKKAVTAIIAALEELYPEALCSLEYMTDYQLLFSTRLSAQCTDERVNKITPALFARYPSLEAFASADIQELESMVHSCGFYHHKARDIQNCARVLLAEHGGRVPDTMEALLSLPGVGRKTANLILGDLYHKPAVVTDTHCIRISGRLGFTDTKDPYKVELALQKLIPPEKQSDFCHRLVLHGRALCMARGPQCGECPLAPWCDFARAKS